MNISAFSEKTGISAHTLRYYEKLGLLTEIARNSSGHRDYRSRDVDWVNFITRLKETGMPLEQILDYAELRAQGAVTFPQRRMMLKQHYQVLEQRIRREQEHLQALKKKIAWYEKEMLDLE